MLEHPRLLRCLALLPVVALVALVALGSLACAGSQGNESVAPTSPTIGDAAAEPDPTAAGPDGGSTASGDAGAAPSVSGVKTLFVRESLADCVGESPRKCMQVRESPTGEWTFFYSPIEGFKYEESYRYELRVEPKTVANPPADSSSIRYRLVEVVSKTKALPDPKY